MIENPLAPTGDADTRLLVLGSLPGVQSLRQARYYANPRNQFWRLMQAVIGVELDALDYPARLEVLRGHRIGLWDVIASAERIGSLDAAIRKPAANPLRQYVATLPSLRAVAFNGATSARIGGALLGGREDLVLVPLPSSSPAYTLGLHEKLAAWIQLRAFLATPGGRPY